MSAARTRSPRSSASPAAAACNMCSNAWASDRRLGLVHAPLQHRLKLGVAKFLDRFPWRGVRGADPVIHEGFAHILGGEFVLPLKDPATTQGRDPRRGELLE